MTIEAQKVAELDATVRGARHAATSELHGRVRRTTLLLHCIVTNLQGETIGKVEDLVIDKDEGYVAYAVISFGGFLGVGEKLFAIPFSKVILTGDESCVVADFSKAQLDQAPTFATESWPTFDRRYGTTLHDHYKTRPYWDDLSGASRQDPTRISKEALDEEQLRARGMCRASKAIGTDVEDLDGKSLGDIDERVFDDRTARIVYAVLSFGGFLGVGDKLFAIPWQSLRRSREDADRMIFDVAKERLQAAPGFDHENWPDMADRGWGTEIHKYYGHEPYWNSLGYQRDLASGSR